MSGQVWCCNVFSDLDRLSAYAPVADTSEDRKKYIQLSGKNRFGLELDASAFPLVLRAMDDPPPSLSSYSFASGRFPLVSPELAVMLGALDLGRGRFFEVRFETRDEAPLSHKHMLWKFGNRKDTLAPDQCRTIRRVKSSPDREIPEIYAADGRLKDDDIAVSMAALDGPDVWIEPKFPEMVFFSDRFRVHLAAQGSPDMFLLTSARALAVTMRAETEGLLQ